MKPEELAATVQTKDDFLKFLAALRSDLELSRSAEKDQPSSPYGPNALGWENTDLDRFLDAMQAWTADMDQKFPKEPSWNSFARMFLAGKSYE